MGRVISILEISQKQAYIFSSNKVKDNITNSAVIASVLEPDFIKSQLADLGYTDDNMVYSGGGHTVLEFSDMDMANRMIEKLTREIYKKFEGLQVFAKSIVYDDAKNVADNLLELTKALEMKKSVRKSAFSQGSYGIEKIDSNTLKPKCIDKISAEKEAISKAEREVSKRFIPADYDLTEEFEKLGGSKGVSNFIAVVHIDGNGMGKRVEELYSTLGSDWVKAKNKVRQFSESIDADFKEAYMEMADEVGKLIKIDRIKKELDLKGKYFPVRRIITAGDDICFVAEGRIGIECARIFIEKLKNKVNSVDNKGYSACAGVALVHAKYPFYKAYEMAEMLCSSAKSYGAKISAEDNGRSVSSIDWHIEFGELQDTLGETRANYETADGLNLVLRPYIVDATEEIMNDEALAAKRYDVFKKVLAEIRSKENKIGNGKLKELRGVLKQGINATEFYLKFNRIEDIISAEKRSVLFDAIEIMDTFIPL